MGVRDVCLVNCIDFGGVLVSKFFAHSTTNCSFNFLTNHNKFSNVNGYIWIEWEREGE
jgi:hypothetical protein